MSTKGVIQVKFFREPPSAFSAKKISLRLPMVNASRTYNVKEVNTKARLAILLPARHAVILKNVIAVCSFFTKAKSYATFANRTSTWTITPSPVS